MLPPPPPPLIRFDCVPPIALLYLVGAITSAELVRSRPNPARNDYCQANMHCPVAVNWPNMVVLMASVEPQFPSFPLSCLRLCVCVCALCTVSAICRWSPPTTGGYDDRNDFSCLHVGSLYPLCLCIAPHHRNWWSFR